MQQIMQAMHLTQFGDLDALQLAQVPVPQPGTDEVLIRVGACGLNNTDLNLRKGWYSMTDAAGKQTGWNQSAPGFPIIQGADIVGEVVAVGAQVDNALIGQRVMVNPTIYKDDPENSIDIDFIGSERPGGFAEYVAVPSTNVYPVESALTDAELATFATSYLTAEHMLQQANITAGETVLITGASGGVGSALFQLVQARGAHPIAVVGRGKEEFARDLGAVAVIPRDVDDLQAALADHTVDAIADVVGGEGFKVCDS